MSTPTPHASRQASSLPEDRVLSPVPTPVSTATPRSTMALNSTLAAASTPAHAGGRIIPHVRLRVGGLVAFAGLAIALLSLYLPWLSGEAGSSVTAIGLTEILDLRSMAPINFLGLLVLMVLASITLFTRLGVFAALNAVVATTVLVAHCVFVWALVGSTGTSDPLISGLPSGYSVTYGPYISALGFIAVIAGSVWAARSAEYLLPDRAEGRLLLKAMSD